MIKQISSQLWGRWVADESDETTARRCPGAKMAIDTTRIVWFHENRASLLTGYTVGNLLISDQPSDPREERTMFELPTPDRLVLQGPDGVRTVFKREEWTVP